MEENRLVRAKWPSSLPLEGEERTLSVICGETFLNWSLHADFSSGYRPVLSWRTPSITEEDVTQEDPTEVLRVFLHEDALKAFFGQTTGELNTEMALEHARGCQVSIFTVYILGSNKNETTRVAWCFSHLPSRLFLVPLEDFFSIEKGFNPPMSLEQLVCMRGILDHPALLIQGETNLLVYTATDHEGKLVGYGIMLGLMATLQALSQSNSDKPNSSKAEDLYNLAKKIVDEDLRLNAYTSETGVVPTVACALRNIMLTLRSVIQDFLKMNLESDKQKLKIITTGKDGELLSKLLQSRGLVEQNPTVKPQISYQPLILPSGISSVLKEKEDDMRRAMEGTPMLEWRLIGSRVAKNFGVPDKDGDCVYRGTILEKVQKLPKTFRVFYDDMDSEEMYLYELRAALLLYSKIGEKSFKGRTDLVAKSIEQRKMTSKENARFLKNNRNMKKARESSGKRPR